MGHGKFRPPLPHAYLRNGFTDFYEVCPANATHHTKFDLDPTTWVVWANTQFDMQL